jgi:periplasmic copper chaperone A
MWRSFVLAGAALVSFASTVGAEEHDHETRVGSLTVTHPWTRAAGAGNDTVVFLELSNAGDRVTLMGAESEVAERVDIVGAELGTDGEQGYQAVGAVDVPSGDFDFDPGGLGLLLSGLRQDLAEGDTFELELQFSTGEHAHIHVEVQSADAVAHSHAGHSH